MKEIKILNLDLLFMYHYNNTEKTDHYCRICNKHIMFTKTNKIKLTQGKCKHVFHKDCIDDYIRKGNILCPIDLTPWAIDYVIENDNKS